MSVINILMQLRKVCNHPNLFDPRPIISPFQMEGITYTTASAVLRALYQDPLEVGGVCTIKCFCKRPAENTYRQDIVLSC